MPIVSGRVSVTDPIDPALKRVKTILFSPFDLNKWFIIGFCAWLSSCGEGGGGGGGGGGHGGRPRSGAAVREEFRHGLEQAWNFVLNNLGWLLPLVIFLILAAITVWLIATWLNSHGKFMLLHCVAQNRAEVVVPWNTYSRHAHGLFLFQACLGALSFLIIAPIVIGCGALILSAFVREVSLVGPIIAGVLGVLCAIGIGIGFTIVKKLVIDFVVPIMYLRTPSIRVAWREFQALCTANLGRFVLYLLFSLVLAILIGTLILLVVLVTCCIAGCLMAIPYVGAVLLLPVFVFRRAYSLYYLEQYGPNYRVIAADVGSVGTPGS